MFRGALAMQRAPLPRRQIFLCLFCVRRLDSAIFWESQKRPKLDASSPIYWLPFLLWESAIFLVWEMRRLSYLTPIRHAGFFALH